jgi:hypothetical protein
MKKERQRLRKLADGGEGQQRLLSIGAMMCVIRCSTYPKLCSAQVQGSTCAAKCSGSWQ